MSLALKMNEFEVTRVEILVLHPFYVKKGQDVKKDEDQSLRGMRHTFYFHSIS